MLTRRNPLPTSQLREKADPKLEFCRYTGPLSANQRFSGPVVNLAPRLPRASMSNRFGDQQSGYDFFGIVGTGEVPLACWGESDPPEA